MRYFQIIKEDYKTAAKRFIDNGANPSEVDSLLSSHRELKNRMKSPENNIDWWASNKTYSSLKSFLQDLSGMPTSREMKKSKTGRSYTLFENDKWLIVIPLDKDASCFHGKGSDWCTTKPFQNYYENYFYDNQVTLIYCLDKNTGNKWAIAAHKNVKGQHELFDRFDNPIDDDTFIEQTKLDPTDIIAKAHGEHPQKEVDTSRETYATAMARIKQMFRQNEVKLHENNLELEKLLLLTKNSEYIIEYFNAVRDSENYNVSLQKVAVNTDPYLLGYIKNPEKSVIVYAIKKDGSAIRFVEHQTEELKKLALEASPSAFPHINEPISEELQILAVSKSGRVIKWIDDPSEAVQMAAVTSEPSYAIPLIKNPTKNVIMKALAGEENYSTLDNLLDRHIKLDENEFVIALSNSDNISYMIKILVEFDIPFTTNMQIAALKSDPSVVQRLIVYTGDEIDPTAQIAGALENGYAFMTGYRRFLGFNPSWTPLPTPTPEAVEAAFKTGHLIDRTVKMALDMKIKPTYLAFKNAIDSVSAESNTDVIDILKLTFTSKDHNKLVNYALEKAQKDNNKMLERLVKEYIKQSDLDNLSFEPEE